MTRILLISAILTVSAIVLSAQQVIYNFDDCSLTEATGTWPDATTSSPPDCQCGAQQNGMYLDGGQNHISFDSDLDTLLLGDFTMSFYFRLEEATARTDIFSIRSTCQADSVLAFTYEPASNNLVLQLASSIANLQVFDHPLDTDVCWHRFVLTKSGLLYSWYIDDQLVRSYVAPSNVEFGKSASMAFSNSPCLAVAEDRMQGWIDEFTIHTRALTPVELTANDLNVDQIITSDTTIVQGESVIINTGPTCATTWTWTPAATIDDPSLLDIVVTPEESTTYTLNITNIGGCLTADTVRIFVLNEDALDCQELLLPNAFTPNNDLLNDQYGISNLFLVEELEYFEIYDRWGAKVWETTDKAGTWDGNYGGTPVNPGMFIYKVKYTCKGDEYVKLDNFSVLR